MFNIHCHRKRITFDFKRFFHFVRDYKKECSRIKSGRISIQEDERSGRPKTATTENIVWKIPNAVLNNRRHKIPELADVANTLSVVYDAGISKIGEILKNIFVCGMVAFLK